MGCHDSICCHWLVKVKVIALSMCVRVCVSTQAITLKGHLSQHMHNIQVATLDLTLLHPMTPHTCRCHGLPIRKV